MCGAREINPDVLRPGAPLFSSYPAAYNDAWFYYKCLFTESGPLEGLLRSYANQPATGRIMSGTQAAQTRPMKTWRGLRTEDLPSHLSFRPCDLSRRISAPTTPAISPRSTLDGTTPPPPRVARDFGVAKNPPAVRTKQSLAAKQETNT